MSNQPEDGWYRDDELPIGRSVQVCLDAPMLGSQIQTAKRSATSQPGHTITVVANMFVWDTGRKIIAWRDLDELPEDLVRSPQPK